MAVERRGGDPDAVGDLPHRHAVGPFTEEKLLRRLGNPGLDFVHRSFGAARG
jgi:hypothetical protein